MKAPTPGRKEVQQKSQKPGALFGARDLIFNVDLLLGTTVDHSLPFHQNINRCLLHKQSCVGDTLGSEEIGMMCLWYWGRQYSRREWKHKRDVEVRWRNLAGVGKQNVRSGRETWKSGENQQISHQCETAIKYFYFTLILKDFKNENKQTNKKPKSQLKKLSTLAFVLHTHQDFYDN